MIKKIIVSPDSNAVIKRKRSIMQSSEIIRMVERCVFPSAIVLWNTTKIALVWGYGNIKTIKTLKDVICSAKDIMVFYELATIHPVISLSIFCGKCVIDNYFI